MRTRPVTVKLTAQQAYLVWAALDGAADAGSGSGGNSEYETWALGEAAEQILKQKDKWKRPACLEEERTP